MVLSPFSGSYSFFMTTLAVQKQTQACSLGCVPCRAKAPLLVHDEKAREEALLQVARAEAQAAEAAAKAAEAAKAAKEAEAAAAARQAEIKEHKPELDHIMVALL
jgi:hypothetical protein